MRRFFRKKNIFQPEIMRESADALSNPGCGWYHLYTFDVSETEAPLYVACQEEELVLLRISFGVCRERELLPEELKNIFRILQFFQEKKKGMILRFVYDMEGRGMEAEPVGSSLVKKHMCQIGSVVRQFIPDVLAVQGILVGNWGEMHGSKFLTEKYLKELTQTMLESLESRCFLAVRTPGQFQLITSSMTEEQQTQVSLFNDGMFGSATDLGTYGVATDQEHGSQLREKALQWQHQTAGHRFNGGEVLAGMESEADRQRWQNVKKAADDMAAMHISYLNSTYQQEVLQRWKEQEIIWSGTTQKVSGYEYIGRHLGYRFVVRSVSVDRKQQIHIDVENCGFAELCQQAECFLILEQGDKKVCQCVQTDPESWESGKITELTAQLQITEQFSDTEEIRCYLCLKRSYDGRYIRFANEEAGDDLFIGTFFCKRFARMCSDSGR